VFLSLSKLISFNKSILLSLFSFLLLSIYFIAVQPSANNDTYYHLTVGREVLQTHQIPQKDNFVFGSTNTYYISNEWLTGTFFYLLVSQFGLEALFVPRIILGLLTLYFIFRSIRLVNNNLFINAISILLVGYLLSYRLSSRPEMFSFVFLSIVNFVCLHFLFKNKFPLVSYFIPIIFLLWPNLHGFFPLGILILTFFSIIFLIKHADKQPTSNFYHFLIIDGLTLLALLIQYPRLLAFLYANSFSQYITEWVSLHQRLFPSDLSVSQYPNLTPEVYIFILVLLFYILFMFKTFRKNSTIQNAISGLYFCLLLFPFKFYRLLTPTMVLLSPYFIFLMTKSFKPIANNGWYLKTIYLLSILVISYSILIQHPLGGGSTTSIFPSKGMAFIKSSLSSKRLFTIYAWDDYFLYNIPTLKTFSDVMTQYRSLQDLKDEQKLHSPESDIAALLGKYDIDTVVNTEPDAANIVGASLTPVYNLSDWKLVYVDNLSSVYARNEVVKNNVVNLSLIHPEFKSPNKYSLENEPEAIKQFNDLLQFDNANDFARSQLIFYYFIRQKDLNKAKLLAEESKKLNPENPFYSFILASVYFNQNNCIKAREFAEESLTKNISAPEMINAINKILNKCTAQSNLK